MNKRKVLIIDDNLTVIRSLKFMLDKAQYEVETTRSAISGLNKLKSHSFDAVLSDVMMPEMSGLDLLMEIRTIHPEMPVIIITGQESVRDAVFAMKAGAFDYLSKPIAQKQLLNVLNRALREQNLQAEVNHLRAQVDNRYGFKNIIGATTSIQKCFELVEAVADSTALVLLTGPTGTGKELLARALHYRSPRKNSPFIVVNCAALPPSLLESELFGHEKGSFTGAIRRHIGRLEQASRGSLLLDEIGEIDLKTQVKLLRFLQSGEIRRIGGQKMIKVETRVIAATNKKLKEMVDEGLFRKDLYYRLNVFTIPVPPLKDRIEDIPVLIEHFIKKYAEKYNRTANRISAEALARLVRKEWPGNIRELEHLIERAIILCKGVEITVDHLPHDQANTQPTLPSIGKKSLPEILGEIERKIIVEALKNNRGIQAQAAKELFISRANIAYRIKKLGIKLPK